MTQQTASETKFTITTGDVVTVSEVADKGVYIFVQRGYGSGNETFTRSEADAFADALNAQVNGEWTLANGHVVIVEQTNAGLRVKAGHRVYGAYEGIEMNTAEAKQLANAVTSITRVAPMSGLPTKEDDKFVGIESGEGVVNTFTAAAENAPVSPLEQSTPVDDVDPETGLDRAQLRRFNILDGLIDALGIAFSGALKSDTVYGLIALARYIETGA